MNPAAIQSERPDIHGTRERSSPAPHTAQTASASGAAHPHYVMISKFAVANGMTAQIKELFRNRPHKVDEADGFLRMDVISPLDDPDEVWLITFWRDEASYQTWHHSDRYRDAHQGIPKGLKLVPRSANIRAFEAIST